MALKSNAVEDHEGSYLLGNQKQKSRVTIPSLQNNEIQEESSPLWSRIRVETCEQLDTALPTLQGMVFTKIPWLISLRFVGEIGAEELAAAALATTLCNVTGLSLSVGLSSALSTLAGQAKGELLSRVEYERCQRTSFDSIDEEGEVCQDTPSHTQQNFSMDENLNPITPMVFLFRGMLIQLGFIAPIAIWWLFGVEDVLVSLGQAEHLSAMTSAYLRILAPGLLGYSINWTMTAWLQSIGMADVPAKASVLGLILHIPFNWFFIYFLNWGYLGCGIATVCFYVVQPIFVICYVFGWQHGRDRVLEATGGLAIGRTHLSYAQELWIAVSSVRGYIQYLGLALPGIIIISEWWASETTIFLSGRLLPDPELAVGGMTIYQSINTFCFMFPVAFAISASTRVGNLLGAGRPDGAAFAAYVSIGVAGCLSFILGTLLLCIPHTFLPSLFAPDAEGVILETSRTIPLLAFYVFADGIQAALNGVIKGCGRQVVTIPIVVVAYWVVGVPLAYYIAFVANGRQMFCEDSIFCGDAGLVAGMTTGTWVHMLLLGAVVGMTTDWELESKRAKQRVAEKH